MQNLKRNLSVAPKSILLFGLALAAVILGIQPSQAQTGAFDVTSRIIKQFLIGSNQIQFGPLEFAGGLEMVGTSRDFGAISGIDLASDQSTFIAVADTGFWIRGKIDRREDNAPSGLSNVLIAEITDATGAPIRKKWQADAEGIIVDGQQVIISFERAHRIANYLESAGAALKLLDEFAPPVPLYELRNNRGFEGIAIAPVTSSLDGSLVGISEKSLDNNRNIMGFVKSTTAETFEFSVARKDEFDITDLAFLPDGDLIILERRFNMSDGIGMRLRHIESTDIQSKATVDGPIILEADFLYQIDNMEGLTITIDPDGTPRLTLVSDDNHSLLQRNLLLEFRLTGEIR